jgi:hypothetical protein
LVNSETETKKFKLNIQILFHLNNLKTEMVDSFGIFSPGLDFDALDWTTDYALGSSVFKLANVGGGPARRPWWRYTMLSASGTLAKH